MVKHHNWLEFFLGIPPEGGRTLSFYYPTQGERCNANKCTEKLTHITKRIISWDVLIKRLSGKNLITHYISGKVITVLRRVNEISTQLGDLRPTRHRQLLLETLETDAGNNS